MDKEQGTLATPTPPALVIATTGATLALELAHTLAETLVKPLFLCILLLLSMFVVCGGVHQVYSKYA